MSFELKLKKLVEESKEGADASVKAVFELSDEGSEAFHPKLVISGEKKQTEHYLSRVIGVEKVGDLIEVKLSRSKQETLASEEEQGAD